MEGSAVHWSVFSIVEAVVSVVGGYKGPHELYGTGACAMGH